MSGYRMILEHDLRGRAIRKAPLALLVVVAGSALFPARAEAARIRANGFAARSTAAANRQAWGRFLAGGPTTWAATPSPAFPSNPRLPLVSGGLLQTPFVDYLLWRRALNPTRFDANHPNVARVFEQLTPLPAVEASTVVPPTTVADPRPVTPRNPVAQTITPEPGSLAIAATALGAVALWRARRRSR